MRYILYFLIVLFVVPISAQKTRKQLEGERRELRKEIKRVNRLLFDAQKKGKNALEDLKDLNQKIDVRERLIQTINRETQLLAVEITNNEKEIQKLSEKLSALKADYAEMIYKSYKS